MKKRKFNILLNIAVLCMCVCAIAIGVYSARTASLNVSGTIGFNAHNCEIAIKGEMNAYEKVDDSTNRAVTKYFNSTNAEGGEAKTITGSSNPWNIGTVCFDDLNTDKYHQVNDIVFTFEVTNMSAYYVDVTVDQNCINNDRIFIYAPNNGETLAPKDQTGSSVTLTVKFQLKKDSSGEYSSLTSDLTLSNISLLNFTKSQAPAYLATDWQSKITEKFSLSDLSGITRISFLRELGTDTLTGFNDTSVSLGAVNETSKAGNLTENVSDVVAYYNSTNKEVVIYSPARIYAPQKCSMFFGFMSALAGLDFTNFDTSKVTVMNNMFYGRDKLTNLDLTNFDTSNITDMSYMFQSCSSMKNLIITNFNTSKVTNISWMFLDCSILTSLDVTNFDTREVTDMSNMFASCGKLTNLDVRNFDTGKVKNMLFMFQGCSGLTSLNVTNFNTSNVTNMGYMFGYCSELTSLDLSNFNTSKVTNMDSMFCYCSKLENIYVNSSNWSTTQVTSSDSMFSSCTNLPNFNSSLVDKTNAHTGTNGYLTEKA